MKNLLPGLLLAALMSCGCSRGSHPGRTIHITSDGVTLDAVPVTRESLRYAMSREFGATPIRVVASPGVPIGYTVSEITPFAPWITFSLEGETNAVLFLARNGELHFPISHEVRAFITPTGVVATTNAVDVDAWTNQVPEMRDQTFGLLVFFYASSNTLSRDFFNTLRGWEKADAIIVWDWDVESNPPSDRTR